MLRRLRRLRAFLSTQGQFRDRPDVTHRQIRLLKRWGPVGLISEFDGSDVKVSFAFDAPQGVDAVEAEAFISRWRANANRRYALELQLSETPCQLAHVDSLKSWIGNTLAVARDVRSVYGERLAALLEHAASEIEAAVSWPELRIENPPNDPVGRAALFVTVDLWAFDQVRSVLEGSNSKGVPGTNRGRTLFLGPVLAALQGVVPSVPVSQDEMFKKRIRRFAAKIKPGQHDDLVADVLFANRAGFQPGH